MTVPVSYVPTEITANGVTTVFPYNFPILAAEDLEVSEDEVVVVVGFTIDGVGELAGGNVTYSVAPADGVVIGIRRNMAIKRDTDYQNLGDLRSDTLNDDQDAPIMMLQQLAYDLQELRDDFDAVDLSELNTQITEINTSLTNIIDDISGLETRIEALEDSAAARQQCFVLALSDTETPITAGTKRGRFRMPYHFVPIDVKSDLGTAQTSGSAVTIDCNLDGVSMLSVKSVIDNGELESGVSTIDVAALAGNAEDGYYIPAGTEVTFDIDQVGDGTAIWPQVTLRGYQAVTFGVGGGMGGGGL